MTTVPANRRRTRRWPVANTGPYLVTGTRMLCDLTQDELAEATGISARQLRDWESGKSVPQAQKLSRLTDYLESRGHTVEEAMRKAAGSLPVEEGIRRALAQAGWTDTEAEEVLDFIDKVARQRGSD